MTDRNDAGSSRPSKIPTFATIEEEAAFWDTHDTAEFADELEPVEDVYIESIRTSNEFILRLTGDVKEALYRVADAQGVSPAAVARRWLEEGIRSESRRKPRLAS